MLQIENLSKHYNDVIAVNDISFTAKPGVIFGLLGPNGAGKTTTIRSILNIIKPTSGNILFNNVPITNQFNDIIGYLPEERGLYKKNKVIDIITFFAELKNIERSKAIKEAEKWLKRLDIELYRDKKLEELSKGNQQKIQFITAVLHNPQLLILDEPFSGFDPINQQLIKDLILNFVSEGKIIILSTHQMEIAEKLCSEIFLINQGKEVLSGSLTEIKRKFGTNQIRIDYNGDASFIKTHPSVIHFDNYSTYAEIELDQNILPQDFLRLIIDRLKITQFSLIEPTLNKIFIDVIRHGKN